MEWWGNSYQFGSLLLLDDFPGAAAAYSLRLINSSYTGPVIRVRRSTDNAEQDFTANQISSGSLVAFCGAGNGFIRTWHDQSGNNRHATQTTTSAQPQIVSAGSLILEGGLPAINFNGSSHRLDVPVIAFSMNALSVHAVCRLSTAGASLVFLSSAIPNRLYLPFYASPIMAIGYAGNGQQFNFGNTNATTRSVWQLNAGSLLANAWRNGTPSTAISSNTALEAGSNLSIGSYKDGVTFASYWSGTGQELIFYTSDQTANRVGILNNVNGYYGVY